MKIGNKFIDWSIDVSSHSTPCIGGKITNAKIMEKRKIVIYICISYIFCSRVFYLVSCLVCGTYRNISEHIVLWVSFFRLLVWSHSSCKYPRLFRFVVFKYFHSYVVSYFMLIRVFVNLLFSVTVFNNVSCQVC